MAYAQGVLENPPVKALYAARIRTPQPVYHAALSDYLHAPQIIEIAVQSYIGKEGNAVYGEQGTAWIYTAHNNVERWEDHFYLCLK